MPLLADSVVSLNRRWVLAYRQRQIVQHVEPAMAKHEPSTAVLLVGREPLPRPQRSLWKRRGSATARGARPAGAEPVPAQYLWGQAGWRRSASFAWERHSGTGEGQNTERGSKRRARGEFAGRGSSGSCPTAASRGCTQRSEVFLRKW